LQIGDFAQRPALLAMAQARHANVVRHAATAMVVHDRATA
jgi:hypothetical protein